MMQQLDTAIAFVVVMLLLSLLVTAIVQAISALLDLRGRNLTRALTDLFKQIEPNLRAAHATSGFFPNVVKWFAHPFSRTTIATKLADAVSKHPILAHTFTRAKAIRKDELLKVLKDLNSADSMGKIEGAVRASLNGILTTPVPLAKGPSDAVRALVDKISTQAPGLKDEAAKTLLEGTKTISQLEAGVDKWFGTVMDRSSDIFTRWTRLITVAVSILFVSLLHIDSGMIFHQISTSADIRTGLSKLSDLALTQADEVLRNGSRASSALKEIAANQKAKEVSDMLNAAPPLVSCAEGQAWLKEQNSVSAELLSDFMEACQKQTVSTLSKSEDQIYTIRRELAATQLTIVPSRIGNTAVFGEPGDTLWKRTEAWAGAYRSKSHLLGTLAMVILLSLGAPFWYNALKQLSNLKPSITQRVESEAGTK